MADSLQDGAGAVAAGEVADLGDALVAAFGDDVGGAEVATEVGTGLVALQQPRHLDREDEVDQRHRQEGETCLQRRPVIDALHELRGEEEKPHHRAHVEHPGDVGAAALSAREQSQRHDRLRGPPLHPDEQAQHHRAHH